MVAETVTIKPDMRVIHPEHGDITEDVARELAAIRREDNERLFREAEARQAAIVRHRPSAEAVHTGKLRLRAEIDPQVHAYWRMREGKDFWKHELEYMQKRHPELRLRSVALNPSVSLAGLALPAGSKSQGAGHKVSGKRGRWAL